MALNVLGKQFDKLLNVTLCYPDNNRQPFFDMLSGKLTRIVVHVDLQPIADELHGDYINDKSFKRHFRAMAELTVAGNRRPTSDVVDVITAAGQVDLARL